MIEQLRELGWDGPIRAICSTPEVTMETAGGPEVVEGVYCSYPVDFDGAPRTSPSRWRGSGTSTARTIPATSPRC